MISDYTAAEWNDLQDRLAGGPGWRARLGVLRAAQQATNRPPPVRHTTALPDRLLYPSAAGDHKERNALIVRMARDGVDKTDIAREFNLCVGRINQIVAKDNPTPRALRIRAAMAEVRAAAQAVDRRATLHRIKGFDGDARKYGIWIEA